MKHLLDARETGWVIFILLVLLVSLVAVPGLIFASLAGILAGCALTWREAKAKNSRAKKDQ